MNQNTALLLNLALQAATQLQQYQLTLSKAASENRDVTLDEVNAAINSAQAAVDALKAS